MTKQLQSDDNFKTHPSQGESIVPDYPRDQRELRCDVSLLDGSHS
jgi:hypothetical protein